MTTKYRKQLQNSFRNDFHYMTNTNFGRGINLIRPTDKNNPTSTMSLTLDSSPKSDDSGVIITLSNIMNGIGISINESDSRNHIILLSLSYGRNRADGST